MNAAILQNAHLLWYRSLSSEASELPYLAMRFESVVASTFLTFATSVFMLKLPIATTPSVAGALLSHNTSASSFNTSANSFPPIHCDGSRFGINLKVDSCIEALKHLPKASGTDLLTFGYRQWGNYDVVVPNRFLSCMFYPESRNTYYPG